MRKILIVAILATGLFADCSFWFKQYTKQTKYVLLLLDDRDEERAKVELPILLDYNRRLLACHSDEEILLELNNHRKSLKSLQKQLIGE